MLDAIMFERSRLIRDRKNGSMSVNVGRAHSWQTGYVREVQVRRMVQLVREPNVRHYCEVGMNGGHSVAAMLLANPAAHAHVFDIMKLKYSWTVAELLSIAFRERFNLASTFMRGRRARRCHSGWKSLRCVTARSVTSSSLTATTARKGRNPT
jgi:hypothetical protein